MRFLDEKEREVMNKALFESAKRVDRPTPTPDTVEAVAKYWSDWLVDAVAMSTQDRRYLKGEKEADDVAVESIRLNAKLAVKRAIAAYEAGRK